MIARLTGTLQPVGSKDYLQCYLGRKVTGASEFPFSSDREYAVEIVETQGGEHALVVIPEDKLVDHRLTSLELVPKRLGVTQESRDTADQEETL